MESRRVVARGKEGGMGNYCLMHTEFQFCKVNSSGDPLHNNVNVFNTAELHT